jgi:hypothetical protein
VASRETVIQHLRDLGEREFAELFYDIARARSVRNPEGTARHLVLADAARDDGKWVVEVIAGHDPAQYRDGWAPGVPICQSGTCESCGNELRSWAKHMLCPICGATAYGS